MPINAYAKAHWCCGLLLILCGVMTLKGTCSLRFYPASSRHHISLKRPSSEQYFTHSSPFSAIFFCSHGFLRMSNSKEFSRLDKAQNPRIRKGFNLLELIPVGQGPLVWLAREIWRLEWLVLMTELAPQSKAGGYMRTGYSIRQSVPSVEFPLERGRYHVYLGNPW